MTLRLKRISLVLAPSVLFAGMILPASDASAQTSAHPSNQSAPESPYGGSTVEEIVARVNDQIISRSDYDRAYKEMDQEGRQRGETMQQIAEDHKDLLRNLIDQQLWLSKGKELGINGETELVKQLDEIRKKYNLETIEDLEKAAREQNVSFEDFKAGIRNQIITREVMRDQVGRKVNITPGEAQRYFEAHKQEYAQPEAVRLSEILVSTGDATTGSDDPQKLAAAKAKADDIEARLKSGADFSQLARSNSDGQTAAEGGDLGKYTRDSLAKVLADATFGLKVGEFTEPIRTRQGYVIFKVTEHIPGGIPAYKDVQEQVEEAYYESRMEPAMRAYLTTMREQAYIDIKPGYVDTGASAHETKPIYSAYTPPAPKKKKKVVRTRFRETERGFHKKQAPAVAAAVPEAPPPAAGAKTKKVADKSSAASMKPGKKEKIRFGQAPRETLPAAAETKTEDAGALPKVADNSSQAPENPLEAPSAPTRKSRFSDRAKLPKAPKSTGPKLDNFAPSAPDPSEVADRQTQSSALGLSGDTSKPKKVAATSTGPKKRMKDREKKANEKKPIEMTPAAPVPGAPAPATAPKSTDSQSPAASGAPQPNQ
jgi:peptidyl-prolyl cis-trans isomerase SurA